MRTHLPSHLSSAERAAIAIFCERLQELVGADIRDVLLYGSRARGEGHEESDLDLAVRVADGWWARRREIHDIAYDATLQHGVLVAPVVLEDGRWDHLCSRELLFASDLRRDGISLLSGPGGTLAPGPHATVAGGSASVP